MISNFISKKKGYGINHNISKICKYVCTFVITCYIARWCTAIRVGENPECKLNRLCNAEFVD